MTLLQVFPPNFQDRNSYSNCVTKQFDDNDFNCNAQGAPTEKEPKKSGTPRMGLKESNFTPKLFMKTIHLEEVMQTLKKAIETGNFYDLLNGPLLKWKLMGFIHTSWILLFIRKHN